MSIAEDLINISETILSDIGDRFEKVVKILRDAGFVTASYTKGDAAKHPQITMDNGTIVTIDKDSGNFVISFDPLTKSKLHSKQRFFKSDGELIQILNQMK